MSVAAVFVLTERRFLETPEDYRPEQELANKGEKPELFLG